jgi:hypothetical protein
MIEEFGDLQMSPPISLQGSLLRLRLHSSVAVAVSVISCEFFVLPRLTGPPADRHSRGLRRDSAIGIFLERELPNELELSFSALYAL